MLSMGFETQVRSISREIRPDRQTLLFSATFPEKVRWLVMEFFGEEDAVHIVVGKGGEGSVNEDIKQEVVILEGEKDKWDWLSQWVREFKREGRPGKVIVFVNGKALAEEIAQKINQIISDTVIIPQFSKGTTSNKENGEFKNKKALALHGDKLQFERTNIINAFKHSPTVQFLVATDLASRGLDVSAVDFVINFESPNDPENYIHRVGRTGRAGNKNGVALSLLTRKETKFAGQLLRILKISQGMIPADLEDLALRDEIFRENHFNKKGRRFQNS